MVVPTPPASEVPPSNVAAAEVWSTIDPANRLSATRGENAACDRYVDTAAAHGWLFSGLPLDFSRYVVLDGASGSGTLPFHLPFVRPALQAKR